MEGESLHSQNGKLRNFNLYNKKIIGQRSGKDTQQSVDGTSSGRTSFLDPQGSEDLSNYPYMSPSVRLWTKKKEKNHRDYDPSKRLSSVGDSRREPLVIIEGREGGKVTVINKSERDGLGVRHLKSELYVDGKTSTIR